MSPHSAPDWKYWPRAWYVVARSKQLSKQKILSGQLADKSWVIYRGADGAPQAIDAFCPHMGAHLQSANVVGDSLQCGLHALRVAPEGHRDCDLHAQSWPCAERFGLIWLHPPGENVAPLPFQSIDAAHHWLGAGPERIHADWRAMICNGFDLAHMQVVHQRAVVGEPIFERLPDGVLQMTYRTKVLNRGGLSSWLMNKLSGGTLNLIHTCAGSSIMVQSQVGRFRTTGIFALLPQENSATAPENRQTLAFAAVGIPRGAKFPRLQLWLARALYLAFLRKDFRVVENMRLTLEGVDDPGVQAVAAYQHDLDDLE